MKILPAVTSPSKILIERNHKPGPAEYTKYANCLRWDFGFTCAFCLRHEYDISPRGRSNLGVWTAEHTIPKAGSDEGKARKNDYTVLVYCCRPCNSKRSTEQKNPTIKNAKERLLFPTDVVWSECFEVVEGVIKPKEGPNKKSAEYTARAYEINHDDKVEDRIDRQQCYLDNLGVVERGDVTISIIQGKLRSLNARARNEAVKRVAKLRRSRQKSWRALKRYRAIPAMKTTECQCETPPDFVIPPFLKDHLIDIPDDMP